MDTGDAQSPIADLEPVPPPRRRAPIFWVLSVVVVGLLVAGSLAFVGHDTKTWPATVVLSQAAARTTGAGTAQIAMTVSGTVNGEDKTIVTGSGATDYGNKTSTITLKIGTLTEEVRVVQDVTYASLPGAMLPKGAHWVSVTQADLKTDPGAAALGTNDPSSGLQFLSAVDGDPIIVGREQVDGVATTHYGFTLNLKAMFDRVGDSVTALNSSFGRELKSLASMIDLANLPGEAWIDSAGRVRKFVLTIPIPQAGPGDKVIEELRFSHFDEPVDVQAPPAAETVPFSAAKNLFG